MVYPTGFDINNDLKPAPNYAQVFQDAYANSMQMGQAIQQQQSQQAVNKSLAAGDYDTAQHAALAAGNTGAINEISSLRNNQIAQAQARLDHIASTAYTLKQVPLDQRPQAFEAVKPMLKSLGLNDQQLANVNLTDTGLDQYIGQALDLKTKIEMHKPMDVAPGHAVIDPTNPAKPLYSAAPEYKYETITRPDGSTFIAAVNPMTNQGAPIGTGVPGQAPAATSAAPTAAPAATGAAPAGGDAGFQAAINTVLHNEGSALVAHDGNGAPVRFGINQGANPDVNVANLTRDQAVQLYKSRYWDKSQAPNLPVNMQTPYFDVYVRNPKVADRALAQSGGDPAKFMQLATGYFGRLAQSPKFAKYATAWSNRDANNMAIATGNGGTPETPATPESAAPTGGSLQEQISAFQSGGNHPHYLSATEKSGAGYPADAVVFRDAKGVDSVKEKGTQASDAAPLNPQALNGQTEIAILNPKSLTVGGMGGAKAKTQIANNMPAVLAQHGLTAQDVPQLQNLYASDSKAIQARTQQLSFLNTSYTAARQHAGEVRQLANQLQHMGNFKLWNQGVVGLLEQTPGTAAGQVWQKLKRAADQYSGEIAKVITGNPQSGAGPVTDTARQEFQTITSGLGPSGIIAKLDQDDHMMREKVTGPQADLQRLKARQASGLSGYSQLIHGARGSAPAQSQSQPRSIVRSGIQKSTGKRVVQYSDGTVEVQ